MKNSANVACRGTRGLSETWCDEASSLPWPTRLRFIVLGEGSLRAFKGHGFILLSWLDDDPASMLIGIHFSYCMCTR